MSKVQCGPMEFLDLINRYHQIDRYFRGKFPEHENEYQILARLGKITEELGELNSAVYGELKLHREEKQIKHTRQNLEDEWGDVFNTVMLFGLTMDIDMEKAIENRLKVIFRRFNIPQHLDD